MAKVDRGVLTERYISHILHYWKRRGKIDRYIHAEQGSDLDHCGIDFVVVLNGGTQVFLQIKSSVGKTGHHKKLHPCVELVFAPPVYPEDDDDIEAIKKIASSLQKIINCFIKKKFGSQGPLID